jgi:glycosyltransferase involved in cell wall biosynthesis
VLFTAHGWAFNEDRPWWQRLLIKTLHWLTVLLAHKTIAVSNAIITQMNWPLARRKMKLVHLGRTIGPMYEKREARTHLAAVCPRLAPFTNAPWLGCVAELHPIKRHTVLIDAVQQLILDHPTLRLVFIGDGELREAVAARIVDARLESVVFLTGAIPEAARFLKAFDICVLASKSESYGYVLHEAGLATVPTVATAVGGIPDVITNEQTGLLVPADDASALATAIARLLTDQTYANTLAQAHNKAMTERSVTAMTNATAALYLLPL